jgi:lipopolysaccharide transport system ATP-binding protein
MSSEAVIVLKNISKCFKQYAHPIERIKDIVRPGRGKSSEHWALQDINLVINKGETLGLIGKNGSGKSTLLQMIAGTLTPTQGEITVNGRISALLELGSGFNPEFTGRQNVFFNGRLLGLPEREIEDKFDAIAAFADIGPFIDRPVKTYSSGMFVRLAFAVAINVEPDILIVDEALAVGDEAFQRKCFSRIKAFQEAGKTILFVSHSAATVVELCNWSILIDGGEILLSGPPKLVVSKYHKLLYAPVEQAALLRQEIRSMHTADALLSPDAANPSENSAIADKIREFTVKKPEPFYDPNLLSQSTLYYLSRGAEIREPYITTLEGKMVNNLVRGEDYIYRYSVYFSEDADQVRFAMLLKTLTGLELGGAVSHVLGHGIEQVCRGTLIEAEFKFSCWLFPGVYFLNNGVLGIIDDEEVFLHRCVDAVMLRVQPEEGILGTCIVDFQVESNIALVQESLKLRA